MDSGSPRGLSAQSVKLLALIAMTIDHLAVFGASWPPLRPLLLPLRTVGRISAPLFLFLLTFSVEHTRSRPRFLLRLYLAGAADGLMCLALSLLAAGKLPPISAPGIFHTFCYTALYCSLADACIRCVKCRDLRRAALPGLAAACSLIPTAVDALGRMDVLPAFYGGDTAAARLLQSVLPSVFRVDYGPVFVLLGLVMFLARTKPRRIAVFAGFTALCAAVSVMFPARAGWNPMIAQFVLPLQLRMILAVPVMLLYDGTRGRGTRWGFYLYYPLHRIVLWLLAAGVQLV